MPKITRSIVIDTDILAAIEEEASIQREKPNAIIQRACLEYLQRAGAWPPKKEAK